MLSTLVGPAIFAVMCLMFLMSLCVTLRRQPQRARFVLTAFLCLVVTPVFAGPRMNHSRTNFRHQPLSPILFAVPTIGSADQAPWVLEGWQGDEMRVLAGSSFAIAEPALTTDASLVSYATSVLVDPEWQVWDWVYYAKLALTKSPPTPVAKANILGWSGAVSPSGDKFALVAWGTLYWFPLDGQLRDFDYGPIYDAVAVDGDCCWTVGNARWFVSTDGNEGLVYDKWVQDQVTGEFHRIIRVYDFTTGESHDVAIDKNNECFQPSIANGMITYVKMPKMHGKPIPPAAAAMRAGDRSKVLEIVKGRDRAREAQICVQRLDGQGGQRRLGPGMEPVLDPEGRSVIAVEWNDYGDERIVRINAATRAKEYLTPDDGRLRISYPAVAAATADW